MRILDRYIAKTVLASIALVTLMLAGLQLFILFVNQLDDLGKGNYGIVQAAAYVALQMPYQLYLFFPMASLLGALIGLGMMANHRELVVMRAAGMSLAQITQAVLKAAICVMLLVTVVGECLVPRFTHIANDLKMQALSNGQTLRTSKGVWMRYQNDFINFGSILQHEQMGQVFQFHFDDAHRLQLVRRIESIRYQNGKWQAEGILETIFHGERTEVRQLPQMIWDVPLKPAFLSISSGEPDEMTLKELQQYLRAQKGSHQTVLRYQLAYWQRLMQPLTTMVMMVLAIPFIFGPLRSSTMGAKLLAGATVGFGFHIINRFFGPFTQVFQWPPEIAAFGPTCLFALLGLYLMKRVR